MQLTPPILFILRPLALPPENWRVFEKVIAHHRYYHILEDVFKEHSDIIPPDIKSRLKAAYSNQLHKQLQLAKELQYFANEFEVARLDYINFKGTALALQLYGKIAGRLTRDIDFLIYEKDINNFLRIFHDSGYELIESEKDKAEEFFRRVKKNYTLVNQEKNIIVELHWNLFSNPKFYPKSDSFFCNPEMISLGDIEIPVMNRENHFKYLCMHGIYHEYFRLFWLRDIAEASVKWNLDLEKLIIQSKKEGIDRVIMASLILVEKIYRKNVLHSGIIHDKKTLEIVDHCINVINRSSQPDPSDRLRRIKYFMDLKRGFGYKMACVSGVVKRYLVRI